MTERVDTSELQRELRPNRIYQIERSVRALSDSFKAVDALPSANLKFIARDWHSGIAAPGDSFNYTYFMRDRFDDADEVRIKSAMLENRSDFEALLASIPIESQAKSLRKSIDYFRQLVERDAAIAGAEGEFHHHLVNVYAAIPLNNYIPGELYRFHQRRTRESSACIAYRVAISEHRMLDITEILPRANGGEARRRRCKQRAAATLADSAEQLFNECLCGELTITSTASAPRPSSDISLFFFPVYEHVHAVGSTGEFCGRLLGWLFHVSQYETDFGHLRDNARLRLCFQLINDFSIKLLAIDSRAFSTIDGLQRNPGRYVESHLPHAEGWSRVQWNERKWEHGDSRIWTLHKINELEVRLGPVEILDDEDWGGGITENFGSLTLTLPDDILPRDLHAWHSNDVLRLVRRLREMARRLWYRSYGMQFQTAKRVTSDWAHEVKNYLAPIRAAIDDSIDALPTTKGPTAIRLRRAHDGTAMLLSISAAMQMAFDPERRISDKEKLLYSSEAKAVISHLLGFLIHYRAATIAGHGIRWCELGSEDWRQIETHGAPEFRIRLRDGSAHTSVTLRNLPLHSKVNYLIAFLREVIWNTRHQNDARLTYGIDQSPDYPDHALIEITQEGTEDARPSGHQGTSQSGIKRAQWMFGPEFLNIGTLQVCPPTIRPNNGKYDVTRKWKFSIRTLADEG